MTNGSAGGDGLINLRTVLHAAIAAAVPALLHSVRAEARIADWPGIAVPCASLPTAPLAVARIPAADPDFSTSHREILRET